MLQILLHNCCRYLPDNWQRYSSRLFRYPKSGSRSYPVLRRLQLYSISHLPLPRSYRQPVSPWPGCGSSGFRRFRLRTAVRLSFRQTAYLTHCCGPPALCHRSESVLLHHRKEFCPMDSQQLLPNSVPASRRCPERPSRCLLCPSQSLTGYPESECHSQSLFPQQMSACPYSEPSSESAAARENVFSSSSSLFIPPYLK